MPNQTQADQITRGPGFIAALDQSGGSTPKALRLYGIDESAYRTDEQMYDLIHDMRSRIALAPEFTGDKVIGAILFEKTMDREIGGKPAGQYLWEDSRVVPFLKVDKGLEDEQDGVKLMKEIGGLDDLLRRAVEAQMFGTKMRSVIDAASESGIAANVAQQFEVARAIMAHGLVPIIEPEVTISIADKSQAEDMLRSALIRHLDALPDDQNVMLKLTLPETPNQYKALVDHPRVMRVVALSGGYSREEANTRLARNSGVVASFSRALTEGLSADQDDDAFRKTLGATIDSIYDASVAG
ncbi:MAG: fructose bisphosphate aldolase [Pseudomonadota bacterium]